MGFIILTGNFLFHEYQVSATKANDNLRPWIPDIINHFWYALEQAKGDKEKFKVSTEKTLAKKNVVIVGHESVNLPHYCGIGAKAIRHQSGC